ncbi:ATP-binding cassette domain-containing protein [Rhodoferax sp. GW822-FHT02A01]|uniref:ABC transporter ATP-binding protein n=1 Tax=Rhodoferax sp. GW822-FHT02A01 TaxID=3141537 RepID=UPI00315D3FF9
MSAAKKKILTVSNLTMKFGGITAIDGLSMSVNQGSITSIIGPNGAGKTTLFNCLTGFYKPTSGSVVMHHPENGDMQLECMSTHKVASHANVMRTFQNIRLFPKMTVMENLIVAQHNRLFQASGFSIAGLLKLPRYTRAEREAVDHAWSLLRRFSLTSFADTPAGALSYGVQRRVEIARAMCARPMLLCLDEPAAGLNPKESLALNDLLLSLSHDDKVSVLLVEHDMSVVMNVSDEIYVISYGKKIAVGSPNQIQNDPHVIAAYLGEPEVEDVQLEMESGQ